MISKSVTRHCEAKINYRHHYRQQKRLSLLVSVLAAVLLKSTKQIRNRECRKGCAQCNFWASKCYECAPGYAKTKPTDTQCSPCEMQGCNDCSEGISTCRACKPRGFFKSTSSTTMSSTTSKNIQKLNQNHIKMPDENAGLIAGINTLYCYLCLEGCRTCLNNQICIVCEPGLMVGEDGRCQTDPIFAWLALIMVFGILASFVSWCFGVRGGSCSASCEDFASCLWDVSDVSVGKDL